MFTSLLFSLKYFNKIEQIIIKLLLIQNWKTGMEIILLQIKQWLKVMKLKGLMTDADRFDASIKDFFLSP